MCQINVCCLLSNILRHLRAPQLTSGFPFTTWVSGRIYIFIYISCVTVPFGFLRCPRAAQITPGIFVQQNWAHSPQILYLGKLMGFEQHWRERPEASPNSMWMSTAVSPSLGIPSHTLEWCMLIRERWFILVHQKGSKCGILSWVLAVEVEVLSWSFRSQTTDLVNMDTVSGEKEVIRAAPSTGGSLCLSSLETWFLHCGVECLLIKISAAGNSSG